MDHTLSKQHCLTFGIFTDACFRFAPESLSLQPEIPGYAALLRKLAEDDEPRFAFLKACLEKLGLEVSAENASLPPLSELHLSGADTASVSELVFAWSEVTDKTSGQELIKGGADTFRILSDDGMSLKELEESLPAVEGHPTNESGIVDYSLVTKNIVAHEKGIPEVQATPRFDHGLYFANLKRFQLAQPDAEDWGSLFMYGDVVTSTNSLLEK